MSTRISLGGVPSAWCVLPVGQVRHAAWPPMPAVEEKLMKLVTQ